MSDATTGICFYYYTIVGVICVVNTIIFIMFYMWK